MAAAAEEIFYARAPQTAAEFEQKPFFFVVAVFKVFLMFWQWNNHVGDTGACGLGEGLKVTRSLQWLNLVRHLDVSIMFVLAFSLCSSRQLCHYSHHCIVFS